MWGWGQRYCHFHRPARVYARRSTVYKALEEVQAGQISECNILLLRDLTKIRETQKEHWNKKLQGSSPEK